MPIIIFAHNRILKSIGRRVLKNKREYTRIIAKKIIRRDLRLLYKTIVLMHVSSFKTTLKISVFYNSTKRRDVTINVVMRSVVRRFNVIFF